MKYKIAILIHATAVGNRCHAQCAHLQSFKDGDVLLTRCLMFRNDLLWQDKHGRTKRSKKCIAAQRRASRAGHSEAQLPLFGRVA
mgnify:CR=1 FL=1